MAGIRAYGRDYTEDLVELRGRGKSIKAAAEQLGISERTAYRLLAEREQSRTTTR